MVNEKQNLIDSLDVLVKQLEKHTDERKDTEHYIGLINEQDALRDEYGANSEQYQEANAEVIKFGNYIGVAYDSRTAEKIFQKSCEATERFGLGIDY